MTRLERGENLRIHPSLGRTPGRFTKAPPIGGLAPTNNCGATPFTYRASTNQWAINQGNFWPTFESSTRTFTVVLRESYQIM